MNSGELVKIEKLIESRKEPLKNYIFYAFAPKVLAVAVINERLGNFSVYIDAVEGMNHFEECKAVASYGNKMTKHHAKIIFPILFEKYVWRD